MYLDLLDSAKSGHPISIDTKNEWWRAKDIKKQGEAISVSHAGLLMRLLYGDTIVLPSNQALDSVAWLKACAQLTKASDNLEYPLFTWAAFRIDKPTPDSFIETAIQTFKPKENDPKQFKLSAWPGIDNDTRKIIAENLKTKRSFKEMFDNTSIDQSLKGVFEEQQDALINFYDYLFRNVHPKDKHYLDWTIDSPKPIKKSREPQDNPRRIWNDLKKTRDRQNGIPGDVLDKIEQSVLGRDNKGTPENLENRSALYTEIQDLDPILRDRIKKLIDIYYNKKNSVSVVDGYGLMSVMDQDPNSPVEDDEKLLNFVEELENADNEQEKALLYFFPGQFKELSTLSLKDCVELLAEPKMQSSIRHLRSLVIKAPGNNGEKVIASKYRDWSLQFREHLDQHQRLLVEGLPGKVKLENEKLVAILPSVLMGSVFAGAAQGIVTYFGLPFPVDALAVAAGTLLGLLAPVKLEDKIDARNIPTSAAARIDKKIERSITHNFV